MKRKWPVGGGEYQGRFSSHVRTITREQRLILSASGNRKTLAKFFKKGGAGGQLRKA